MVRVSHQRAHALESGGITVDTASEDDDEDDPLAPLRPVSSADFKYAILKVFIYIYKYV
jgi:hypothetical protein